MEILQSRKLANVLYDIRGPVLEEAKRLEAAGHRIIKLNIGNPGPFGFETPPEVLVEVVRNLPTSQGYSDSLRHLVCTHRGGVSITKKRRHRYH